MPDPFDPAALAVAKAQAEDRLTDTLTQERTERQQRRLGRPNLKPTPRETTRALRIGSQHRQYAQAWYDALRFPRTREVKLMGSFHYDDATPHDVRLIGTGRPTPATYLRTPAGEFDERNVGQIITDMTRHGTVETKHLGKLLDRLRHTPDTCLIGLTRDDGRWHQHRERATRYALAVLTLAVRLGVQDAEGALKHVQAELRELART